MINYKEKYLKYKKKYLKYKKSNLQKAGGSVILESILDKLKECGVLKSETPEEKQNEAFQNYIIKLEYTKEQIKTLKDDITKLNTELYDTNKKLENINEFSDKYEENLILLNNHIRRISNKLSKNEKNLKDLQDQQHNYNERIGAHTEKQNATNVPTSDISNYHLTFGDNVPKDDPLKDKGDKDKNGFYNVEREGEGEGYVIVKRDVPDCKKFTLG